MMAERSLLIKVDCGKGTRVVTFSANGKHILSGNNDGVHVWRVADGKRVASMPAPPGPVNCLSVSQDGKWIAAVSWESSVWVWDAETYKPVSGHWSLDGGEWNGVDFSPNSTRFVTTSSSSTAAVWDLRTRERVQTLEHRNPVLAAKYSSQGDRIATANKDRVLVWDSEDGRLLLDIPVIVASWHSKGLLWFGNHLLVVSDKRIEELDSTDGSLVSEWPVNDTHHPPCIALPKHGNFLAYTSNDTITLFDPSTHSQLALIQGPEHMRSIAFSPDDWSIVCGGMYGETTILSGEFSHQHPLDLRQPDIHINDAVLDSWRHGRLENADALLTAAITGPRQSGTHYHHLLASRALVRARLNKGDTALIDADMANKIHPSVIGYIAKSIAHIGNGERHKAFRACDIAFGLFHSGQVMFLLLVKAVIMFMAGEHVDAISRIDDLIAVRDNPILHMVQAYMHFLLGNMHMERSSHEDAIQSFKRARGQVRPHANESLSVISLIFGWKFSGLGITIRQRLCEALYSAGRIKDASESLLELVRTLEKELKSCEDVTKWVSDFTRCCLSTPESNGDGTSGREINAPLPSATLTPLLMEWAKVVLVSQSWKGSLASAAAFVAPRFAIYQAVCECLEATNRVTDEADCLLEMASELAQETGSEQAIWLIDSKYWCGGKLEGLGDSEMSAGHHDKAIILYSAALSLNLSCPQALFVKRSQARVNVGLWEDALKDANEVIMIDPSLPLGYERKHAALHCAGYFDDAEVAFETMLSKMSQSANPEMQARALRYVKPAQTKAVIRGAVEEAIRKSPSVLINTKSGCLLDKLGQASAFELQPVFRELVASTTTSIDHARIEDEVGQYYRYATFSHKWKEHEPLYDQVLHIIVYELEESPTHTKLQMFCKIAREAGLHWAWSDTCCIDKGNPSVLQEALVSMFQWYQCSTMTVVLLCDGPLKRLVDSIWNSRAWTFQEYHASKVVRFYNSDWTLYRNLDVSNHKEAPEIIAEMEAATGISAQALMALRPGLEDVREKLRLASTRQTTRVEDVAYSLLGIFSLSLPVLYGEGDKALGRLLSQLLTNSGDTSILAWTGISGSFNSCLPAKISVFSQLPTSHIPPVITNAELETITAGFRSPNLVSVAQLLYDRLNNLRVPCFNGKRMTLPCIVFKLGPLLVSRSSSSGQVFRAQTDALGIVEIRTEESLSHIKPLYLIHPWIDFLLDRQPVGSVIETIPEETTNWSSSIGELPSIPGPSNFSSVSRTRTARFASRLGLPFGGLTTTRPQDAASLLAPSTVAETDKRMNVLRVLARLRQPFGALLLTPDPGSVAAYRRVASETLITVRVEEITPTILNKLIDDIRVLDVL